MSSTNEGNLVTIRQTGVKDIRRALPLSRRERPQWDMEALARAGFVRCSCDTGLSGRIFVRRDATYNPVPMFALRAYRP